MLCMYMRCYVMLYRKIIINRITVIMNKSMNQFPYFFFFYFENKIPNEHYK